MGSVLVVEGEGDPGESTYLGAFGREFLTDMFDLGETDAR